MYVVGLHAYSDTIEGDAPALKAQVREAVGKDVRRVGRFIQLALIGAGKAGNGVTKDTAVYLSSGRGDMGAMTEVLGAIFEDKRAPRPLSFINTVSNAACFYVSQSLGLEATSSFISSQYFAFESALQSAMMDAQTGRINSALLGLVDAVVEPVADHCRRLSLPEGTPLGEGSSWLQLRTEPGEGEVIGQIKEVRYFTAEQQVREWIEAAWMNSEAVLGFGRQLWPEQKEWDFGPALPHWESPAMGYLDCTSAATVCDFLSRGEGSMIHLNRDPLGRFAAIALERAGS